jgi:hypothetical protein
MVKSITLQVWNEGDKTYGEMLILMSWKVPDIILKKIKINKNPFDVLPYVKIPFSRPLIFQSFLLSFHKEWHSDCKSGRYLYERHSLTFRKYTVYTRYLTSLHPSIFSLVVVVSISFFLSFVLSIYVYIYMSINLCVCSIYVRKSIYIFIYIYIWYKMCASYCI